MLFFRHGITPTASKLYQYVRKGSMSAPADALTKFLEELRSKARVQIDHPDLPEALKWPQPMPCRHFGGKLPSWRDRVGQSARGGPG